jgi:hypothetical protein
MIQVPKNLKVQLIFLSLTDPQGSCSCILDVDDSDANRSIMKEMVCYQDNKQIDLSENLITKKIFTLQASRLGESAYLMSDCTRTKIALAIHGGLKARVKWNQTVHSINNVAKFMLLAGLAVLSCSL